MDDVDIIPLSERKRINKRVWEKRGQDDGNGPDARRALMAFTVNIILERRVCCRKAGCKSNHRYPICDGWIGVECYFDLLNALGWGMEIRLAANLAKLDWIGSKALL